MASTDPDGRGVRLGYWLSSEEHHPADLVRHAVAAEDHGFVAAMISDHLHPWTPQQGHAPYVWSVLGAIGQATSTLRVGTGVVAPGSRSHPINIAQASATAEVLMPGRFFLGLGSGERLNEQAFGDRWPRAGERRARLSEAIDLIRRLWDGDDVSFRGDWFAVEHAQLHTRPDTPPPLLVAGGGRTAAMAGEKADGLIGVAPDPSAVEAFEHGGGAGKPRLAQLHVCWAATEAEGRATALRWWPQVGLPTPVLSELARPSDFAALAALVDEDAVAEQVVCGPDPDRHLAAIERFVGAGYTEVHVHQVGPDQLGFLDFYRDRVLPELT
ncbi:TIGR03557 family F420-dependent LLM class oxidoreductase [Dermatobacter hominis]|uniref:TIGR03557 family F420-dependent LLM class oxidoreductase n=1 Tax=Dermatobacter hominis TaxID=2884263 RepID=UPI001D129375|nr:TIGR03557 family F420-dependent LLM class oxidoreductase [Dermatobacter hominis]UDY37534.1 TIGR03557 family F420-dependent LLM class oxidoreductase [Dermatobacter hominis]